MVMRWSGFTALLSRCDAIWDVNEKYIVRVAEGVQVHSGPGVDLDISSKYQFGEVFTVLDQVNNYVRTDAGWISVACDDTAEHIADKVFISDPGELYMSTSSEGVLIQSGLSSLSAKVGVIPQGDFIHIVERSLDEHGVLRIRIREGGWVSDMNMQDGSMIAEPVVPKTPENHVVNCPRGLVVRSGSNLSSEIVGWLKPDERFEVLERTAIGDGTIRLRTAGGWISQVSKTTETSVTTRIRSCSRPLTFNALDNFNITDSDDALTAPDALGAFLGILGDDTSTAPEFLDAFLEVLGDNESAEELTLEASFADGSSMVVSPANLGILSSATTACESQTSFLSSLEDNARFWKTCGAKVVDSIHQTDVGVNCAGMKSEMKYSAETKFAGAALDFGGTSGVPDSAIRVHDASTHTEQEDEQPFFTLTIEHPEHVKQLEATIAVHKAVYQGQDSDRTGFHRYRSDSIWRYNPCNGKPMAVRESPHVASQKTNHYKFPGETFAVDQTLEEGTVRFLHLSDGSGWLFDQSPTCKLCEPVSGWIIKQNGMEEGRNKAESFSVSKAELLGTEHPGVQHLPPP